MLQCTYDACEVHVLPTCMFLTTCVQHDAWMCAYMYMPTCMHAYKPTYMLHTVHAYYEECMHLSIPIYYVCVYTVSVYQYTYYHIQ